MNRFGRSAKKAVGVAVLASVLLAGCQQAVRPQAHEPELTDRQYRDQLQVRPQSQLRIGSWNMYYLGSPQMRGKPEVSKDFAAMARYIADSGVEVLALAEVDGGELLQSPQLEKILQYLGEDWKYKLFDQNHGPGLCTGVIWNASRVNLTGAYPLAVDRSPEGWRQFVHQTGGAEGEHQPARLHTRKVFAAHFSAGEGRTDFAVVPLHLKDLSGGLYRSSVQRYFEMATILDALPSQTFARGEYDVILIGDTNCLGGSTEPFMLRSGEATSAPGYVRKWGEPIYFRELGGGPGQDTYLLDIPAAGWGNESVPLDRAYVPRSEIEFASSRLSIEDDMREYAENAADFADRLSDHLLIHTCIWIGRDDD